MAGIWRQDYESGQQVQTPWGQEQAWQSSSTAAVHAAATEWVSRQAAEGSEQVRGLSSLEMSGKR